MNLREINRYIEVLEEVIELLPEDVLDEEKKERLHEIGDVLETLARLRF